MKSRYFKILFVALSVFALASCKKDNGGSQDKIFDGYISLPIDRYVSPEGDVVVKVDTLLTLKTYKGDEKIHIAYIMTDGFRNKVDTLVNYDGVKLMDEYRCKAPGVIGTYKLTLTAKAKGYSTSSITSVYDVVIPGHNGGASLQNYDIQDNQLLLVDNRDYRVYLVTQHGNTLWMRDNLAWEGAGSACFTEDAANDIFGRYYTHEEALTACPEGWALPSEKDWVALASEYVNKAEAFEEIPDLAGCLMEDIYFNEKKMWEFWPSVNISNKAYFSALPAGRAAKTSDLICFYDMAEYAVFWSADYKDDLASARYINVKKPSLYYGEFDRDDNAFNIRCIRKIAE